jgi:hypothetical protein
MAASRHMETFQWPLLLCPDQSLNGFHLNIPHVCMIDLHTKLQMSNSNDSIVHAVRLISEYKFCVTRIVFISFKNMALMKVAHFLKIVQHFRILH